MPARVAEVKRSYVCLSVYLSVCLHDKTKTAETTITKLTTGIVRHESWLPISY